jgi:membrane protease YdiL (CAAX protease family)
MKYSGIYAGICGGFIFAFQVLFGSELYAACQLTLPPGTQNLKGDYGMIIQLFIFMVVVGPICEELLFRGVIFRGLNNSLTFWPALFISSMMFGVYHNYAVPGKVLAGIIGLFLAYIYNFRITLWSCVICHIMLNSVGFVLLVIGVYFA